MNSIRSPDTYTLNHTTINVYFVEHSPKDAKSRARDDARRARASRRRPDHSPTPTPHAMVDVETVQRTWALVASSDDAVDAAGRAFFARIFDIAPGAVELFASFRDVPEESRYESPAFVRHARAVMTAVDVAVKGLRDLDALAPALENLGARHVGYGVAEAHYDVVGRALLETLASALGDDAWTPAAREAWTATWEVVKTTMIRGAREFERKNLGRDAGDATASA